MNAQQIPPSGATAAPSPSGAAGLVALPSEIVRLPQELAARLLNGPRTVFVSGTVTGQGADGTLNIRSQFGEISVRAGTAVPADRQVSLQIPPLGGKAATLTPPQLSRSPIPASLLLSNPTASQVDRGATPAPNTGSQAGTGAAPTSGQPAPAVPPAPSATPPTLSGPPPASTPPVVPSAQGAQPGGAPTHPPQTVNNPAAATTNPTAAPPATPATSPTTGPTLRSAGPASPLPAGSAVSPSQPTSPAGGSPPTQSPATAVPAPAQGNGAPSSTSPLGRLVLTAQLLTQAGAQPAGHPAAPSTPPPAQPALQPGTAAPQPTTIAPQNTTAPASGAGPTVPPAPGPHTGPGAQIPATGTHTGTIPSAATEGIGRDTIPPESLRRVPALREAVSVLSAADPALATQFVRSVLPQANSQLAATLLFFLSATRSGDVRGWMGDRVTATLDDAGRTDLQPRLSAELATPSRAMPDTSAGEWRSQTIPLYQDGEVGGMAVHVRRTGDEGGNAEDGEAAGRRFLIDMDLSRMGPLQFDGVVHETRFDLTIRSPAAFPEPMRQDMRTLFREASNAVGLHGGLTFQTGSHDWASVTTARGG